MNKKMKLKVHCYSKKIYESPLLIPRRFIHITRNLSTLFLEHHRYIGINQEIPSLISVFKALATGSLITN